MMFDSPKRMLTLDIPEPVHCSDFKTEKPEEYSYKKSFCLGCIFSHEFYHKTGGFMSGYERTTGPNCKFGELTEGKYGTRVEIEDENPHPTAVVTLQQVDAIKSWLCYKTITKRARYDNKGEIMYRIADVPQIAVMKQEYGGDKEVPIEELVAFRDRILKNDEDFEAFRELGGHGITQKQFLKFLKKGKTIEEVAGMFK